MASTTSMNAWSEQLVRSLVSENAPPAKLRKHLDQFARTLKHHNYVRTNQFEVQERLSGLEEKFQVFNRADLSDALHKCRAELMFNEDRWIPDILDFLLYLSHHPLKYARVDHISNQREKNHIPAVLKWSDFEADEPFDHRDQIWRQPDYGDLSSDDEKSLDSTVATSPIIQKPSNLERDEITASDLVKASLQGTPNPRLLANFNKNLFWKSHEHGWLTESQVTREILFMVQGLPTPVFKRENGILNHKSGSHLQHLSSDSLNTTLIAAFEIASAVQALKLWTNPCLDIPFMQVLEDSLKGILTDFYGVVSELESHHLRMTEEGGVVSLLKIVEDLQQAARPLLTAQAFIRDARHHDAVGHIDLLLDTVCKAEHVGGSESSSALTKAFRDTCTNYAQHLDEWIQLGIISKSAGYFFVQRAADQNDKARFWISWYTYSDSGHRRAPEFLKPFIKLIFTCGKTVAFTKMLTKNSPTTQNHESLASIIDAITSTSRSTLIPLAASLTASVERYITNQLHTSTTTLQATLHNKCNLSSTLTALSTLYLASMPLATDTLDAQLFSSLDRCLPSWNDRFVISSLLSETHISSDLDTNRIVVHSETTAASTLSRARRSVDVLANIAFDYLLPWPIANILLPETLASYRRVSLLLMQVRRAKHVLERKAYLRLRLLSHSNFRSTSPTQSIFLRKTRTLHAALFIFTTTIYAHLTSCVISPLTADLQSSLSASSPSSKTMTMTIDDLIAHHALYLRNLEFSCLTMKNLKVLKDAIVALLDLCLEFSFSLAEIPLLADEAPTTPDTGSNKDAELGMAFEKKLELIKTQFSRHLMFLIAGLRGVARSSATANTTAPQRGTDADIQSSARERWQVQSQGEMMELLADSLQSALVDTGARSRGGR